MSLMPTWKRVLILGLSLLGLFIALPNAFYSRVETHNDAAALIAETGIAAPELEAARGAWPSFLPSRLVNLGLDLRGGAHLLAEVHVEDVHEARMEGLWPELRRRLAEERATVGAIRRTAAAPGELRIQIGEAAGMERALAIARDLAAPIPTLTGMSQTDLAVGAEGDVLVIRLSDAERAASDDRTMQQALEIIRRRVDEAGTREPTIQRQGADRILIQVPGIGSAEELKALIGTTAQLTFHPVQGRSSGPGAVEPGTVSYPSAEEDGIWYTLASVPVVSGEQLVDSRPDVDQNGRPAVSFRFNPTGARAFGDYTATNIGQLFAIVLDEHVISAPQIQSHIPGGSGIITGNFTTAEAANLAVLLRSGALPADMTFLEERTIGPELGQDSIDAGRTAAIVAGIAVVAFTFLAYGFFGLIANVALVVNVLLLVALLSLIGATLTLPGIAGIVLTMGMAVDANVLIFERMREEIATGKRPLAVIHSGFNKASSAIFDANITAILVAVVLYAVGSGAVRGFAVTLGLGILTTLFTAVWLTRVMIELWYGWRRPKALVV